MASSSNPQDTSLEKITTFLKTKDDTSRFVGLALLKSVLDNSSDLRSNPAVITQLWKSISPKFLDRLLRSGGKMGGDGRNMLDLAVSVIHTFVVLLPDEEKGDERATGRIEGLVEALVLSTDETTTLILQTLLTLVSLPQGALRFDGISDLSPLIEMAQSHSMVLDILFYAWLTVTPSKLSSPSSSSTFSQKLTSAISSLVQSFRNTDAVTFLNFLAHLLRNLDARILLHLIPERGDEKPPWLDDVVAFIHNLVVSRPAPAARSAYTILSASLVQVNPSYANILFSTLSSPQSAQRPGSGDEKPISYLLLNLILIDIRSSIPTLLANLNAPSYPLDALRISSALELIPAWLSSVLPCLDSADDDAEIPLRPDLLLRLRSSVTDTLSMALEYIRDRWDASVSGVSGLDPSYRAKEAELPSGEKRMTLAWDSVHGPIVGASGDPVMLSAIRALAAWVVEDDETPLRKEMHGVVDVLVELYGDCCKQPPPDLSSNQSEFKKASDSEESNKADATSTAARSAARSIRGSLDFRPDILAALDVLTYNGDLEPDAEGLEILNTNRVFETVSQDLLSVLDLCADKLNRTSSPGASEATLALLQTHLPRAVQACGFLRGFVRMYADAGFQVREEWLDFATRAAAWGGTGMSLPDARGERGGKDEEAEVMDVAYRQLLETLAGSVHLCVDVLEKSPLGVRRRYVHTMDALSGVDRWVLEQVRRLKYGRGSSGGDGPKWEDIFDENEEVLKRLEGLRNS